ncbi:hypothetical protein [Mesorhizobium huakuii]|uniref:Uncharacterized protein n=1 Tax=Mesorhizobium huakuii TaxID=28104 RepID=A0A7G6SSA4_9HYPH|nr:hypothetical protein [Mesorhizobium huakuii]QND57386.1 hypothetical protein HB778_12745 [Mesorhizobium huakuii]
MLLSFYKIAQIALGTKEVMMASNSTIDDQLQDTKVGIAILVTCLIQEISTTDPEFTDRVLERFQRAYSAVQDDDTNTSDRLDLLNWVRELLTGSSQTSGQGKPFLAD